MLRHDVPFDELAHVLDDLAGTFGYPDGNRFVHSLLQAVAVPVITVDLAAAAAAKQLREAIAVLMKGNPSCSARRRGRRCVEQTATDW